METNLEDKSLREWLRFMEYGKRLGCHQLPERSFFIKGYQFPVCARCTGVLISSVIATVLYFVCPIRVSICVIFSAIIFLDWFIQRIGLKESNNIRRVITGLLGGYGFMTLQLHLYVWIVKSILQILS